MIKNKYQICTKTIIDTTDSKVIFDKNGVSDYYHNFKKNIDGHTSPYKKTQSSFLVRHVQ